MKKQIAAAMTALSLAAPLAAQAQDVPTYAAQETSSADEQIRGRIIGFDGQYNLSVRDERGFIDNIELHPGTIINPTGITLQQGMIVSIMGYNAGQYLAANEIDTPYNFYNGEPYYQGHPWTYFGLGVGLGFFFANTNWWHGGYYHGGYHYVGGARVYHNVHFTNVYHGAGGEFHGRNFVAPAERGGYYHGNFNGRGGYEGRGGNFQGGGHQFPGGQGGYRGGGEGRGGGEHGGGQRGGGEHGGGDHGGGDHGGGDRH